MVSTPSRARVIVVGGGIMGASVAYHLAKHGERPLLLEQSQLAGGTTWHAAGMVGRLRTTGAMARMNDASARLYQSLEAETGIATGWRQCGTLYVARTHDRMTQFHRTGSMAEHFGIGYEMLGAREAQARFPLQRGDDLVGGLSIPDDGKVEPAALTRSLARGAELAGATIAEGVRVSELLVREGRCAGVRTDDGSEIEAEHVVLCCGMWTRELALSAGVNVPLYPVEHHYAISRSVGEDVDAYPCARDPDGQIYYRTDGDVIWLGAFQSYTKAWMVEAVPHRFSFELLEPDWEKFEPAKVEGEHRLPILREVGYDRFVNGPESFTPDSNFILGETPELRGLWVGAGFNSAGIAFSGGAGEALAEWILAGEQPYDLASMDVRRFAPFQGNRAFLRARVTEALGVHYRMAWPNLEFESARDLRVSPLHERLGAAGAVFGQKLGLERPNWFARAGQERAVEYSFGRQNWFQNHRAEHLAARERVALFDQTGFAKYALRGADALGVLQRLCGNDVDVPHGHVVYTAMLNDRGTFESDLSVIRLADDAFYLVTGTGQRVHDADWIRRGIAPGEDCHLVDVTPAYSVMGLMGPASRALLQELGDADLSHEAFPFGTSRRISVGQATCRAVRITYVGELGFELHVPVDQAGLLYDALWSAGERFGLANAGHYAINSLRLEKAYRAWGADVSPDDTPLEAGLGFALAWDKAVPFRGREALAEQRAGGVEALGRRLVQLLVEDPEVILWGQERLWLDGEPVGYTTSASYGHTLGGAVALAYVKHADGVSRALVEGGSFELTVADRRVPVRASLAPLYDPKRERILV